MSAPAAPTAPAAPAAPATTAVPTMAGEVKVSSLPKPSDPISAPKPGSARERLFSKLSERAKPPEFAAADTPKAQTPTPAAPKTEEPKVEPPKTEEPPPAEPSKPAEPPEITETTSDGKKVSPWRLVDSWKERAAKAEAKILELEKASPSEEAIKPFREKVEKAEARIKELQSELAFHDFQKDERFQKEYEQPFQKAWKRAMSELSDLTLTDDAGNTRPFSANDMVKLCGVSLQEARQIAEEQFGTFANDVMNHRKEIKNLFEAKTAALEDAKQNALARRQEEMEKVQKLQTEIGGFIQKEWEVANREAPTHPEYGRFFAPKEGDDEWNKRLEAGFAAVDESWSLHPGDPKLTADQRREVVRKHAAFRNRAAAFPNMARLVASLEGQIATLNAELAKYRKSEPPVTTDTPTTPGTPSIVSARDRVFAALQAKAH